MVSVALVHGALKLEESNRFAINIRDPMALSTGGTVEVEMCKIICGDLK